MLFALLSKVQVPGGRQFHFWIPRLAWIPIIGILQVGFASAAATYDVGPNQPYSTIGSVPWYSLGPGDVVRIHYQPEPYREKLLISGRGMAEAPIRVMGLPGPNGEQPVISGENATTSNNMHYRWTTPIDQQSLGVLQVGYRSKGPKPGYIEVSNLTIKDAKPTNSYTPEGSTVAIRYAGDVCAVHVYAAEHLKFSALTITNSGNGFFAKSGGTEDVVTRDLTIEYSEVYGNGISGSNRQHNMSTESDGTVIQFNHFGQLVPGALGSIIKDRSAGTVVRYNWIPSASRMLDLVEAQGGAPLLTSLPSYRYSFVYGNVFFTTNDWYMPRPIHYGFDWSPMYSRAGTLYFYNNTFVILRNQADGWKIMLFECSTDNEHVDARNNIFFTAPRTAGAIPIEFDLTAGAGIIDFGPNWISPGWKRTFSGYAQIQTHISGTEQFFSPADNDPGFLDIGAQDFHLVASSTAIDRGAALAAAVFNSNSTTNYDVISQYVRDHGGQSRTVVGNSIDFGAHEFGIVPPAPGSPSMPATSDATAPSCTFDVSPAQASKDHLSGQGTVEVSTLASCRWIAGSTAPWITIASGQSGDGSSTIRYSFTANTSTVPRTGDIFVGGQTVQISQAGVPAAVTVTFQEGVNGYVGTEDRTISNLYYGLAWNKNEGLTDPKGDGLYISNQMPSSTFNSRSLIRFTGLEIPAGSEVISATLTLTLDNWVSTQNSLVGYYLQNPWDALTVNWSSRGNGEKWNGVGAMGAGDVVPNKSFQTGKLSANSTQTIIIPIDVDIVNQWCSNPSTNQGMLITNPGPNWMLNGVSSEGANVSLRPKLSITYAPRTVLSGFGTNYHVGPGQTYTKITDVPWHTLAAGDTVYIHYREMPYYEKFLVSGQGTKEHPIRVIGVPGPNGELPIIDGTAAVSGNNMWTAWAVAYYAEASAIVDVNTRAASEAKKYLSSSSGWHKSSYIEIRKLHVRNTTQGAPFTDSRGVRAYYSRQGACVGIRRSDHVLIEDNILENCGTGLFAAPDGYATMADVTIRGNTFRGHGRPNGENHEHSVYTEANGVLIEKNVFLDMNPTTAGGQIKDRSAGTVIRYNWIHQAPSGRMLDLVEAQNDTTLLALPTYLHTYVYGNILRVYKGTTGQNYIIHYGADDTPAHARTTLGGTLYFYNNTISIYKDVTSYYKTTIIDTTAGGGSAATGANGRVLFYNNVIAKLGTIGAGYVLYLSRPARGQKTSPVETWEFGSNVMPTDWKWADLVSGQMQSSNVTGLEKVHSLADPGFANVSTWDLHLTASSAARLIGSALPSGVANNPLGKDFTPTLEYVEHNQTKARSRTGAGSDLGAFEYVGPPPSSSAAISGGE